tara:strand:+ start:35388 stop:36125 length:738 start_codon:yes stop_codon:yes gene_type:complete
MITVIKNRCLGILGAPCAAVLLGLGSWIVPIDLAYAYSKVEISEQEFDNWPGYCQAAPFTDVIKPPGRQRVYLTDKQRGLSGSIGIWHYCMGLIHVLRAERTMDPSGVDRGFADLMYSYEKIPKYEPWAAEMAVTIARAYRIKRNYKKAKEYLETVLINRPDYVLTYSVLAMLYFDQEKYIDAITVLVEGNANTEGKSAELNYFLGLAYLYNGDIDAAKKQEAIARELGYPLQGLAQKIAEHEQP